MKKLRFAIAGIHIECGTFSPLTSRREDFLSTRGDELMARYPFLENYPDWRNEIEWVPLIHFRAMPGGVVTAEAYQTMKQEILTRLSEAGVLDGFYLDIHGAMSAHGLDDAELDLVQEIRATIGQDLPISCSQDLHGNVSAEFVRHVDYLTAYRTAPHIDFMETRGRAMERLHYMARNGTRPARAWAGIPVLLSGEMTSTEVEPGKTLWQKLTEYIDGHDIWDASLWAGYPWADQKRAMASVVVTGMDQGKVNQTAEEIAAAYWNAREEFRFISDAMPVAKAIKHIEENELPLPIFLSDAGDNPTAGGAGDTTGVLQVLLDSHHTAIFASIPDAQAVVECKAAGVGADVSLSLGGKMDSLHSQPLEVTGTLRSYSERDTRLGPEAVVDVGNVSIILSSRRRPYHKREDFTGLGIDPMENEVTVVKIGYLEPELKAMAASHILLLSHGGVNPDLTSVEYKNLKQPIFPWDREFDWAPQATLWSAAVDRRIGGV